MSDGRRRWLAVGSTIAARLVVMAAGIGGSVVSARALGAGGRGQYYAVITVAAIVTQCANLGLSSSNTLLGARDSSVVPRLMTNSIWLSAACAVSVGLVVLVGGERLAAAVGVDGRLLPVVALLAPATLFVTLAGSILVSEERFGAVNAWQVGNASIALIALVICALTRQGVEAFLLCTTMAAVATACGMAYALCEGRTLTWRFDRVLFASGISFALRAYVAVLAGFLLQRSGATALMLAGDPAQLGVFSIALQIFDVMIILPTTVGLVLFPGLIKQEGSGWNATWAALRVVLVFMAIAVAAVILTGRWLIPTIFGAAFAPSFAPMLALLPSVLAISVVSVLSQYLVSRRFPIGLVGLWVLGFVTAESVAIPAVRRWGGIGAASAQSLGSLIVLGGIALMTFKKIHTESRGHDGGSPSL